MIGHKAKRHKSGTYLKHDTCSGSFDNDCLIASNKLLEDTKTLIKNLDNTSRRVLSILGEVVSDGQALEQDLMESKVYSILDK